MSQCDVYYISFEDEDISRIDTLLDRNIRFRLLHSTVEEEPMIKSILEIIKETE